MSAPAGEHRICMDTVSKLAAEKQALIALCEKAEKALSQGGDFYGRHLAAEIRAALSQARGEASR